MNETSPQVHSEIPCQVYEAAAINSFASIMVTVGGNEASENTIVFVNEAFTAMSGYSADEVLGKTPKIMQGPKSDSKVLGELRDKMKRGEDFHGTTTNYKKDGTEFTIEWKVLPVRDDQGEVTHHLAIQRDLTSSVPVS